MGPGVGAQEARVCTLRVSRAWWLPILVSAACGPVPDVPTLDLPHRAVGAAGGAEVANDIRSLDLEAREERIYEEISRGNVPSWLRRLERVDLVGEVVGRRHRLTFWATPDYVAVGSDSDFLLVPLSPQTAQRVADLVEASVPTHRMVDAIWQSARVRLAPIRMTPGEEMSTVAYFERHDGLIRGQRQLRRVPPGAFVAGHKLDLVLSAAVRDEPGRATVYGWHRRDGQPIQPLYTVLGDAWVNYSIGIRLVHRGILVDGERKDLLDVLQDPHLAQLLNDDGVIEVARYSVSGGG